jgi:hypothetical protein
MAELTTYQTRTQQDLRPYRQALNLPPHLHPENRSISMVDVWGKLVSMEVRVQHTQAVASANMAAQTASVVSSMAMALAGVLRVTESIALQNTQLAANDLTALNEELSHTRRHVLQLHVAARDESKQVTELVRQNDLALRMHSCLHTARHSQEGTEAPEAGPRSAELPASEATSSGRAAQPVRQPEGVTEVCDAEGVTPHPAPEPYRRTAVAPSPARVQANIAAAKNSFMAMCCLGDCAVDSEGKALSCVVRRGGVVYHDETKARHAESQHKTEILKQPLWSMTTSFDRLETHRSAEGMTATVWTRGTSCVFVYTQNHNCRNMCICVYTCFETCVFRSFGRVYAGVRFSCICVYTKSQLYTQNHNHVYTQVSSS